ncbi:DUF742 domain-containing protein [Streptomyces sp. NPDC088768]|uniref:DUF742 domain-containing protein n=1 Tax=Streptomyces sp. NPDC088768 TaxID=3365894 RepID=UPI003818A7DA
MTARGWANSAAARRIPAYALTGGRVAHEQHSLTAATLLLTRQSPHDRATTEFIAGEEREEVLRHCSDEACAIAEISHRMQRPVSAIAVLAGDLIDDGALLLVDREVSPNVPLLERLLVGLKALEV